MFNEKTSGAFWRSRPSVRAPIAGLIFATIVTAVVWTMIPFWIKALYEWTPTLVIWTPQTILWLQWGVKWFLVGGLVIQGFCILLTRATIYELTPDRLMFHHGILKRKHDQIELQRLRDFQTTEPIFSKGLGLGKVLIDARDANTPQLEIGPFLDARAVHEKLRNAMLEHQARTGYREFEST